jgi:hypothetical protein
MFSGWMNIFIGTLPCRRNESEKHCMMDGD